MFERFTEKARRTIFFARYEASQFGSAFIETEHLLLGLLREDKALENTFLGSHEAVESIRKQIERHTTPGERVATSVDFPLSHECKRVLAYGAEEAERLNHKHIGTDHLLLGLLREKDCFAAQLLHEKGLAVESARAEVRHRGTPRQQGGSASFVRVGEWLAEREARGGIWSVKQERVAKRTTHFAIYAGDQRKENEMGHDIGPAKTAAQLQKRIDFIVETMEHAIANHEFDKARFYSDEERKDRENLRSLREQFNLGEPPPQVPVLCIDIIREEGFSDIQKRCDDYIAEGVTQVWLLDPDLKRAYTATKIAGFHEFKGEMLRIANPPLEMNLRRIFD